MKYNYYEYNCNKVIYASKYTATILIKQKAREVQKIET